MSLKKGAGGPRPAMLVYGQALAAWPREFWLPVVLCNCYSHEELSQAEQAWQIECSAFQEGVGYNEWRGSYSSSVAAGKRGGNPLTLPVKPSSPLAGLNAEERREYFRQAGKRGAVKSRQLTVSPNSSLPEKSHVPSVVATPNQESIRSD